MSFFDEADEPRRPSRQGPRRRRPSGRGGPPTQQQAIQTRRAVAVVLVIVVIVLLAVLVHSCDVSAQNSSLRDYTNSVSSLIGASDSTGAQLFSELGSSRAHSNPTTLAQDITHLASNAQVDLNKAKNLGAPGGMQSAEQHLVFAMQMRLDGLRVIAQYIQPALGTSTTRDAITRIATGTSGFYASDVVYKEYVGPEMAAALHADGIAVGGANGETINPGQFLPALGWLNPSFIATELGSRLASDHVNTAAPGLHGHVLNSVSVGATTLSPTATNTVPATPAPTFVLNLTNGGQFTEYNVKCQVTIAGLSDTGTATISQTTAGQTTGRGVGGGRWAAGGQEPRGGSAYASPVSNVTTTAGIVAIAAGAVAAVALLVCLGLIVSLRRLRAAQRVVMGEQGQDLVSHAAELQQSFQSLADYVQDAAARLEQRVAHSEQRLDGAVAYRSLVRYDAYGEMSGQQSTSIALLDATRSGIVLSSIHHRDQARMYAKQVHQGEPELQLSPEEDEAVRLALEGGGRPPSPA
jgi:hypothetical protein